MMRAAVERIGDRVAVADVDRLPLRRRLGRHGVLRVGAAAGPDPIATLAEAARVVRPGGRVITILSNGEYAHGDEIVADLRRLGRASRQSGSADDAARRSRVPGLDTRSRRLHGVGRVPQLGQRPDRRRSSSASTRRCSTSTTRPGNELSTRCSTRLRALPDPDRPRLRRNRHPLLVWTITPEVSTPGVIGVCLV